VYDARTWRIVATWEAHGAGYRSLKFSPVGGGPKALMCAEPADRVSVVNARDYGEANTQSFFGEIAGADWQADGGGFWVGNCDAVVGGFMEYERRGWGQIRGLGFLEQRAVEDAGDFYQEMDPEEWIADEDRYKDVRVADPGRSGRAGNWWRNAGLDRWVID